MFFALSKKIFFAVFEFSRNFFFSLAGLIQRLLQKLYLLLKQRFLFIKFTFRGNMLSLNLFSLFIKQHHFLLNFFKLSFEFFFLWEKFLAQFHFCLLFLFLYLLKMFPCTLFFGWYLSFFNVSFSKFTFKVIDFIFLFMFHLI